MGKTLLLPPGSSEPRQMDFWVGQALIPVSLQRSCQIWFLSFMIFHVFQEYTCKYLEVTRGLEPGKSLSWDGSAFWPTFQSLLLLPPSKHPLFVRWRSGDVGSSSALPLGFSVTWTRHLLFLGSPVKWEVWRITVSAQGWQEAWATC